MVGRCWCRCSGEANDAPMQDTFENEIAYISMYPNRIVQKTIKRRHVSVQIYHIMAKTDHMIVKPGQQIMMKAKKDLCIEET